MSSKFLSKTVDELYELLADRETLLDNIAETFKKTDLIKDQSELRDCLQDKKIFVFGTEQSPSKYVVISEDKVNEAEKTFLFNNSSSFMTVSDNPEEDEDAGYASIEEFQNASFEQILGEQSADNQNVVDTFKSKIASYSQTDSDSTPDLGSVTSSLEDITKSPVDFDSLKDKIHNLDAPNLLEYRKVTDIIVPVNMDDAVQELLGKAADLQDSPSSV